MTAFRLPASCQYCGFLSRSGFEVHIGVRANISNCTSSCLRCGGRASVIEGSLEILERGIRLFSGPEFTKDVLEALGIAVEDLRDRRKSQVEVLRDLEAVSPSLAREFREWANCGFSFIAAMAAVASVVFAWWAMPAGQNRTVEEAAIDAFESIYEQDQPIIRQSAPFAQRPAGDSHGDTQGKNRQLRRAEKSQNRQKLRKSGH